MQVDFSPDQEVAINRIEEWRDLHRKPYFTFAGLAGTGKSTIAAWLTEQWQGTAVCALCGKAANVLRQKGVDAQTIHSLIYVPFDDPFGKVRYRKRAYLDGVQQIAVDEASMIDHLLKEDLLSFGIPVLFIGDHGQLEPIGTNPNLMKDPDVRLEKIHRQAEGNPILRLAAAFREGRKVPYWRSKDGKLDIRPKRDFSSLVRPGVQIICGMNKTRHKVNAQVREMKGIKKAYPQHGERLICLRNNKRYNVFNGQQFVCGGSRGGRSKFMDLEVTSEDGRPAILPVLRGQFGADLMVDYKDQGVCLFDFAYAVTCHKFQGSEAEEILAVEEISNSWDSKRWRYTCVTRAKERLTYCG